MSESKRDIKEIVREKYGALAKLPQNSCCGKPECCGDGSLNISSDGYDKLDGYMPEADLGLGCGLPTQFADMRPGETVLDLGSGAGNDVFVARRFVGEKGKVIGVDMTPAMIDKANENKANMGYDNIEFRLGEIENLPVFNASVDVVLSNCVLNLVPDKKKAFQEIFRVLKSGARFSISDVVVTVELPLSLREAVAMYVGCVAGAITKDEYFDDIARAGLGNLKINSEKVINLPPEVLAQYLNKEEIDLFINSGTKILSITITGQRL
jgi:SAM-dependent methyltransferase